MDGTLWDFHGMMRGSLQKALRELERHDPEAAAILDVDKMVETRDRVRIKMRDVTPDLVEIRKASFRQALIDVGRPDDALAERLSDVYFEHRWAPSRLTQTTQAPTPLAPPTSLRSESPTCSSSWGWQPASCMAIWNRRGSGLLMPPWSWAYTPKENRCPRPKRSG